MKKIIHKVTWKARFSKTKTDITFEVIEEDCYVKQVSHPVGGWMINEPWCRCYSWLIKKCADIISQEMRIVDEFPRPEKNPRRLSQAEWLHRIRYTKD